MKRMSVKVKGKSDKSNNKRVSEALTGLCSGFFVVFVVGSTTDHRRERTQLSRRPTLKQSERPVRPSSGTPPERRQRTSLSIHHSKIPQLLLVKGKHFLFEITHVCTRLMFRTSENLLACFSVIVRIAFCPD